MNEFILCKVNLDDVAKTACRYIERQERLNRNLIIFSVVVTAYSIISRNRIKEQELRIQKLEQKIDELTADE